jgi:putative heme-binding domain-containing protein
VLVIDEINKLSVAERAGVVEDLSSSADGARLLLGGVVQETLPLAFIPPQSLERMSELLPDNPVMQKLWEKEASTLPSALHLFGKPGQFSATQLSLSGPFTVEVWVRLAEGISNADGILGCPGGADLNFHDSRARFYGGPAVGDLVIANRTIVAGIWTHVAVSRDPEGIFRVFLDGELDNTGTKQYIETFSKLDLGRTSPPQEGTHGKLLEFRVWNYARSNLEIRSSFRRKLFTQDTIPWRPGLPTGDYSIPPEGLVNLFPQGGDPTKLQGGARIIPLAPSPKLLTRAAAARQEQELSRFRAMLEKPGDAKRGEPLFRNLCLSCHTVGGEGAGVAPPLDGSSHRDLDSLLRAIATPNAAFEPGYRTYRLETFGGEMYEGYLVKQDEIGTTIGFMGGAQVFVESTEIRRGRFLDRSFMPPGLLDALDEQMVADLFAKLSSLD